MDNPTSLVDAGYVDFNLQSEAISRCYDAPMTVDTEGSWSFSEPDPNCITDGWDMTLTDGGVSSSNGSPSASFGPYTPLTAYSPESQGMEERSLWRNSNDLEVSGAFAPHGSWLTSDLPHGLPSNATASFHDEKLLPQGGGLTFGLPLLASGNESYTSNFATSDTINPLGGHSQVGDLSLAREQGMSGNPAFYRCQDGHVHRETVFHTSSSFSGYHVSQAQPVEEYCFPRLSQAVQWYSPQDYPTHGGHHCGDYKPVMHFPTPVLPSTTVQSLHVPCIHPTELSYRGSTSPSTDAKQPQAYHSDGLVQRRGAGQGISEQSKALNIRKSKDDLLIQCKRAGMSYKEIRAMGHFIEAESTFRGRYRTLTKERHERLRRPQWQEKDISLLTQAVRIHSRGIRHGGRGSKMTNKNADVGKLPWKKVAKWMAEHGGSYHFGNATCKKKWESLQE